MMKNNFAFGYPANYFAGYGYQDGYPAKYIYVSIKEVMAIFYNTFLNILKR